MKITTLIENTEGENTELKFEHGLSMFVETEHCNILFDTGKTGDFIENAEKLNIDLKTTDILVLSHAHYDHCGGVKKLLETYGIKPKLIVSKNFFVKSNKYHYSDGRLKTSLAKENGYSYVGIDFDKDYIKNRNIPIEFVQDDVLKVNDSVYIFSNFNKYYDFEKLNENMKIKVKDSYEIDTFEDEIALGIKTKEGLVILLGCAHPGFLNMTKTVKERTKEKIAGIVGGTHLIEADEDRIDKSIQYLKSVDIAILGLSHCTGEEAIKKINDECRGAFINKTGKILSFK